MRLLPLALFVAASIAPVAYAAPCKTQGALDAKELTFDLNDEKTLEGISAAFLFGLTPREFPEADIAANENPCSRGTFPFTNDLTLELRGEDADMPPRWAAPTMPGPIVYVAAMPKPEAALRLVEQAKSGGSATFENDAMMYAVVLTRGDAKRYVFYFFDKIPDDARLKALLRPIVISQGRWQVMFDMSAMKVTPNTR